MAFETNSVKTTLLVKISQGEETAFRQLFDMYYQKLFHVAVYFLKSNELAEEAVSDVFYIIWKKKESLLEIDDIEKYLYTSIKNQALQYIRRPSLSGALDSLDLYTVELIPDVNNPEMSLLNQEYLNLIQDAINSLPDRCREVFRLVQSDKLKHKEIAQILDVSEKTVESHIANAYKKIALYVNKKYNK